MRWVVVAHPDDEIIFAGGAILSHPEEPWTVVVATWTGDSARGAESLRARDALRGLGIDVDYRFLGHQDIQFHPAGGLDLARFAQQLDELGVVRGERVYTHGLPGEYGHGAHKAVHGAVERALGAIATISTFSGGGLLLERIIDPALLARKILLFSEAYPSQQGVWIGLPKLMLEVTHSEPHFALAYAEDGEPESGPAAGAGNPPDPDQDILSAAVREQLGQVGGVRDTLAIGLSGAAGLQVLRSSLTGRIDVIEASNEARADVEACPGAELVAGDIVGWDPGEASYDLILWIGSLQHVRDFTSAFERAARLLRPGGRFIFTHEPLIEDHPRQGKADASARPGLYRRPTQAVLDLARRGGLRVRLLKDFAVDDGAGEPVMRQLVHLQRR